MTTIKSHTDLQQSKKLAEILPLESADMGYLWNGTSFSEYPVSNQTIFNRIENIPCWSLAALLNVMQEPELIRNSEGTWLIRVWYNMYPFSRGGYNNPVDACYEMILKLHELNLL